MYFLAGIDQPDLAASHLCIRKTTVLSCQEFKNICIGYDSVILSMGFRNYNPFGEEIKAIVPDTYVIGDATRARRALDATKEAYEVASTL